MNERSPGQLHPGGYAVVPLALLRDPRTRPAHIGVYAAISSAADFKKGIAEVRLRRLAERSHLTDCAVRKAIKDLEREDWQMIGVKRQAGRAHVFVLLPTPPQDLVDEQAEDEAALDPEWTGGLRPGPGTKRQGPPTQVVQAPEREDEAPERNDPGPGTKRHPSSEVGLRERASESLQAQKTRLRLLEDQEGPEDQRHAEMGIAR